MFVTRYMHKSILHLHFPAYLCCVYHSRTPNLTKCWRKKKSFGFLCSSFVVCTLICRIAIARLLQYENDLRNWIQRVNRRSMYSTLLCKQMPNHIQIESFPRDSRIDGSKILWKQILKIEQFNHLAYDNTN